MSESRSRGLRDVLPSPCAAGESCVWGEGGARVASFHPCLFASIVRMLLIFFPLFFRRKKARRVSRMSFAGLLLTSLGLFVAPSPVPNTTREEAVTLFEPPDTPIPSPDPDGVADVLEDMRYKTVRRQWAKEEHASYRVWKRSFYRAQRRSDKRFHHLRYALRSKRVMREVMMHMSFTESLPLRLESLMTPHDVRTFMKEIIARTDSLLAVLTPIGRQDPYDASESYDSVEHPFPNDKALKAALSTDTDSASSYDTKWNNVALRLSSHEEDTASYEPRGVQPPTSDDVYNHGLFGMADDAASPAPSYDAYDPLDWYYAITGHVRPNRAEDSQNLQAHGRDTARYERRGFYPNIATKKRHDRGFRMPDDDASPTPRYDAS